MSQSTSKKRNQVKVKLLTLKDTPPPEKAQIHKKVGTQLTAT